MRNAIDYAQLNAFSSVVLYKDGIKRKKGTLYEAERLIERRRKGKVRKNFSLLAPHSANILQLSKQCQIWYKELLTSH